MTQEVCTLLKKTVENDAIHWVLQAPQVAKTAQIGQFVQVACPGFSLRRPISLAAFDAQEGTVELVFEVRGKGTARLADVEENEQVDLLGPLGHGFTNLSPDEPVLLVGGGIGTPPLLPIALRHREKAVAVLGFQTKQKVILQNEYQATGVKVMLCTDDGSEGQKGLVTIPMEEQLKTKRFARIYACGPLPMLKAVAKLAQIYQVPCEVSLEERMGCGVGACLVCACKTKAADGGEHYAHVCKNGPVFMAEEVCFE